MTTAIFIPTYHRAGKIRQVSDNIRLHTKNCKIYFICEPDDTASIKEVEDLGEGLIINKEDRCYAGAINTAYKETTEPYFFTGADDLNFHDKWLEQALSHMTGNIGVVGTNDLGNIPITEGADGRDATHYLVSRKYIQEQGGCIDKQYPVLYPYIHNYTDKEFIETAKPRGAYAYCPESRVEHMHWAWGKGQMDPVYQYGFSSNETDRQTYMQRQHLWKS